MNTNLNRDNLGILDFGHLKNKVTLDRQTFVKRNKINNNNFSKELLDLFNKLGLDINVVKQDGENSNYQIPLLLEPILAVMCKNFKNNKVFKKEKSKISIQDIIDYNDEIFKAVDKLPKDLQVYIKDTESYKFNYQINILVPTLVERISLLFDYLFKGSSVNSSNIILEFISYIDSWIESFEEKEKKLNFTEELSNLIKGSISSELEGDEKYIIDSALKSCFNNQVIWTKVLKHTLSEKNVEEDISTREKMLKYINYENIETGLVNKYYENLMNKADKCDYMYKYGENAETDLKNKNNKYKIAIKETIEKSIIKILKLEKSKKFIENNYNDFLKIVIIDIFKKQICIHKCLEIDNYTEYSGIVEDIIYICEMIKKTEEFKNLDEDSLNEENKEPIEFVRFYSDILYNKTCNNIDSNIDIYLYLNKNILNKYLELDKNEDNKIKPYLYNAIGQSIVEGIFKEKKELKERVLFLQDIL
ncbi:hypothetical protein ACYZFP_04905 [Clostridioides difficile]